MVATTIKNKTEVLVEKLMANKVPKKLWIYLTVDFITKLLLVVGKNVILVVCNRLSKMVYFNQCKILLLIKLLVLSCNKELSRTKITCLVVSISR